MSPRPRPITGTEMEAAAHPWPALGALLLRDGALTVEQLEQALRDKDTSGKRLGEILVDRGYVTPTQVSRVLAEQHELPFIDLARETVDMGAAGLLSEDAGPPLQRHSRPLPRRRRGARGRQRPDERHGRRTISASRSAPPSGSASPPPMRSRTRSRGSTPASSTSTRAATLEEPGATVVDLREAAASAPAIKQVNAVLSRAIELGASDVHFTPQRKRLLVRARVDGVMRELATIPKTLQPAVTSRLKVMAELDIAEKRAPQDGRLSLAHRRPHDRPARRRAADDLRREGDAADHGLRRVRRLARGARHERGGRSRRSPPPSTSRSAPSSSSARPAAASPPPCTRRSAG